MAKRFSKFLRKAALAYKQRAEAQHKKPRIDEIHRYLVHEGVSPELGKKLHETISKQTEVGAGEKVISVIKAAIERKGIVMNPNHSMNFVVQETPEIQGEVLSGSIL